MKALRKVLVIDDDPVVGKSFTKVLAPKGYAVIRASSGAEALGKIAREDYDLVYTDIKMPGMNGLEVARRIKASRPWMPVVIVTGYGSEANEAEAKKLGVEAFLHKPLAPETIESTAEALTVTETEAAAAEAATPGGVPAAAPPGAATFAKNVALFIAAPVVALTYVVVGPLVGLGMLAWFGMKALAGDGKGKKR